MARENRNLPKIGTNKLSPLDKGQGAPMSSTRTLAGCLDLIYTIIDQGRYTQAKETHQEIHSTILNLVSPVHELVLALHQQLVQIRLSSLGPRHRDTLAAMSRLIPMRDLGKFQRVNNSTHLCGTPALTRSDRRLRRQIL